MAHVPDTYHKQLGQRLAVLRRRQKNFDVVAGSLWFVAAVLLAGTLLLGVEAVFNLSSGARLLCLSVLGVAGFLAGLWLAGRPLYRRLFEPSSPDNVTLALKVGQRFEGIRDRLADALEVYGKHTNNREGYSLELADASLEEIYTETEALDFREVAETRSAQQGGRLALAGATFSLLIFFLFSNHLGPAMFRLTHPLREFSSNRPVALVVKPGDAEVIKGEAVELLVQVQGELRGHPVIRIKTDEADDFDLLKMTRAGDGSFSHQLTNLRRDRIYYVEAGKQQSERFRLSVIERPLVRNLHVTLRFPGYSRLGKQQLDENVGDIAALTGSRAALDIETNKQIASAKLVFDSGEEVPLTVAGRKLTGSFPVWRSGSYHIALLDPKGLENAEPIEYRVSATADQAPAVQITFPGKDVDLSKELVLPLSVDAEDDFGISRMRLGYSILQQNLVETEIAFIDLPLPKNAADRQLLNYKWELADLGLRPDDVVTYFAQVFDNDAVNGPKSARSASFRARFPSINELYEAVEQTHEEAFEALDEMVEESRTLKQTIDDVVQKMKRDPELNWEEKQKVQENAQEQLAVQEHLEELQQKLDSMVDRMEENDLVSPETLEKYRELQSLIQEMLTEEMRQALEKMQESMPEMDPKELQKSMQELQAKQEDFLKSMERTLNLLKKLQAEQKLDEMVRRAQELQRRQEALNQEASENSGAQKRQKYAQEQKGLQKGAEDLEKSLEELSRQMSELADMPNDLVDQARKEMGQNGITQKMQQAAQQFQSGQTQSAQASGQQAEKGLQQAVQTLQQAQQQMSQEQKKKIMQALKRSSHDLLDLSKKQEHLMDEVKTADRNTPGIRQMADGQQNIMSGLGRVTNGLYELSQNTFFVTPEIGEALSKAMDGMREALDGLENRNPGQSGTSQAQAMSGLNQAAAEIRKSMQGLSGASSGIGFQEMMQRLMGMSKGQQGINQQTQGLGQQQGGLSPQQQAAMQRLAAQQNALRKSLEKLMQEAGRRSDVLGDLGRVAKEMEDVVKDLHRNNAGRRTIERQKRILSRLLDAQRSMQTRDFSNKRQAQTAKLYETESPPPISEQPGMQNERLRNELLKALKEGYSKDYKELIQKYFEALTNEKNKAGSGE